MFRKARGIVGAALFSSLAFGGFSAAQAQTTPTTFDQNQSSATFFHIGDTSANPQVFTPSVIDPNTGDPDIGLGVPGSLITTTAPKIGTTGNTTTYLDDTQTLTGQGKSSSTIGAASVFESTGPSSLVVGLGAGSGVTQTNSANLFTGPSETDIQVDFTWDLGSNGFPSSGLFPVANYQFNLGGQIGIGGQDEFLVDLTYSIEVPDLISTPIGSINIDKIFPGSKTVATTLKTTLSGSVLLNGGVPIPATTTLDVGDGFTETFPNALTVQGDIIFLAKNDESPSNLNLDDDAAISLDASTTIPAPLPSSGVGALACVGLLGLFRTKKLVFNRV